eukprot:TRINITY_DN7972_c0_g1_i2.p1 TRINITY_DN7972_c0_g1~~TRINITY_DN7972_c0_g1_i2.p1  ORF type:complete len:1717 (+),score=138.53 TRINITY_DN7972_c0_g1_i2:90-5240(+)
MIAVVCLLTFSQCVETKTCSADVCLVTTVCADCPETVSFTTIRVTYDGGVASCREDVECQRPCPTANPSASPTGSPTREPTRHPTETPTVSPTRHPSRSPTVHPTTHPTGSPTFSPSRNPTSSPTKNPSISPSQNPTEGPSVSPTFSPSENPTSSPTKNPSVSPSQNPTEEPSVSPTQGPTTPPTTSPTQTPSASPTKPPTMHPSVSPSRRPSASPTMEPTGTPTTSPSVSPSRRPTQGPTEHPSTPPSQHPSRAPSMHPSESPTARPSRSPSVSPTVAPSLHPTEDPSKSPSSSPTPRPSRSPTSAPSAAPSAAPTRRPTTSPTFEPSAVPSPSPTSAPSPAPTRLPSAMPTTSPTGQPTTSPSAAPSLSPQHPPSAAPSAQPTRAPSAGPSHSPSAPPSANPSTAPTSAPSPVPTTSPSGSPTYPPRNPTGAPSQSPSRPPTSAPSRPPSAHPSPGPSAAPTSTPSAQPTGSPSPMPTALPSGAPSLGPSRAPSLPPSGRPSGQPSVSPSQPPSVYPTWAPWTSKPSQFPSGQPTQSAPSLTPSWSPLTPMPTWGPLTPFPSRSPQAPPSQAPNSPTSTPSAEPSPLPSAPPSLAPTSTHPTTAPSAAPQPPSTPPSQAPSRAPSTSPTAGPTLGPECSLGRASGPCAALGCGWPLNGGCSRCGAQPTLAWCHEAGCIWSADGVCRACSPATAREEPACAAHDGCHWDRHGTCVSRHACTAMQTEADCLAAACGWSVPSATCGPCSGSSAAKACADLGCGWSEACHGCPGLLGPEQCAAHAGCKWQWGACAKAPPETPKLADEAVVTATTDTAAAIGLAAGPAPGMAALALLADDTCGKPDNETISVVLHPLQFKIDGSVHAGCVVGNTAVACFLVLVALLVEQAVKPCLARSGKDPDDLAAVTKQPGGMFVPLLMLYQGSSYCTARLLLHTEEITGNRALIGIAGALGLVVGVPLACWIWVLRPLPKHAAYQLDSRRPCLNFIIGPGEWIHLGARWYERFGSVVKQYRPPHAPKAVLAQFAESGAISIVRAIYAPSITACVPIHLALAAVSLLHGYFVYTYRPYARPRDFVYEYATTVALASAMMLMAVHYANGGKANHWAKKAAGICFMVAMVALILKLLCDIITEANAIKTGRRRRLQATFSSGKWAMVTIGELARQPQSEGYSWALTPHHDSEASLVGGDGHQTVARWFDDSGDWTEPPRPTRDRELDQWLHYEVSPLPRITAGVQRPPRRGSTPRRSDLGGWRGQERGDASAQPQPDTPPIADDPALPLPPPRGCVGSGDSGGMLAGRAVRMPGGLSAADFGVAVGRGAARTPQRSRACAAAALDDELVPAMVAAAHVLQRRKVAQHAVQPAADEEEDHAVRPLGSPSDALLGDSGGDGRSDGSGSPRPGTRRLSLSVWSLEASAADPAPAERSSASRPLPPPREAPAEDTLLDALGSAQKALGRRAAPRQGRRQSAAGDSPKGAALELSTASVTSPLSTSLGAFRFGSPAERAVTPELATRSCRSAALAPGLEPLPRPLPRAGPQSPGLPPSRWPARPLAEASPGAGRGARPQQRRCSRGVLETSGELGAPHSPGRRSSRGGAAEVAPGAASLLDALAASRNAVKRPTAAPARAAPASPLVLQPPTRRFRRAQTPVGEDAADGAQGGDPLADTVRSRGTECDESLRSPPRAPVGGGERSPRPLALAASTGRAPRAGGRLPRPPRSAAD